MLKSRRRRFSGAGLATNVDMMEHSYPLHGHTRSMSSLASTIIPVRSDASPSTTFATSPPETQDMVDMMDLPVELRVPLPASSTCSGDEEDHKGLPEMEPNITEEAPVDHKARATQGISTPPTEEPQVSIVGKEVPEAAATASPAISLEELAQLIRLERYQLGHTLSVQDNFSRVMLFCGLNRRLIRSASSAYVTMLDQFKADNQVGFAALLRACEQLVEGCNDIGYSPQTKVRYRGEDFTHIRGGPTSSWLQDLPSAQVDDIFKLVAKIRTDSDFLPDRISSLSSAELVALSSPYQSASVVDSVLQNQSHGKARIYGRASRLGTDLSRLDTLRNFHQKDVLFALFYDVFDDSSTPGSSEYLRRIAVWSTTCARTTTLGKRGSDEFLNFALNSFAGLQEWPLKPKMELFLIRLLQDGASLLDSSTNEPMDFKQPVEIRKAKAAIAGSNFFDQASKELFKMLTTGSARDSIPGSVLDFAHAFLSKIKDPRIRLRAKNFIAAKWYFSSFLSNILVHPESQGLLMTHHIGATARQAILKELVIRMQKQVIDVTSPWRHTLLMDPDIQACIGQFFQYFEPSGHEGSAKATIAVQGEFTTNAFKAPLMLSLHCITELVRTIFPESPPSSSSANSVYNSVDSTESSVAGSSTLTTGSMERDSGMRSSTAPSISGTSVTSTTMLSEGPFIDPQVKDDQSPLAGNTDGASCLKRGVEEMQEDLGFRLRIVCEKLSEKRGLQTESNGLHSANAWAFIYISEDGEELSMEPFESSPPSENPSGTTEGDEPQWANHKDTNYDFLSEAVIRLLDDQVSLNNLTDIPNVSETGLPEYDGLASPLGSLFHAIMKSCQLRFDFNNAHFWWKALEALHNFRPTEDSMKSYENLLHLIGHDVRTSMIDYARINEKSEKWLRSLDVMQTQQQNVLQRLEAERNALRLKMWYVSDVRHSSTYEDALHVTRALRAMGSPQHLKQPGSITSWARHRLRNSTGHDRTEAQALEALSVQKDYGGPSKLADEQIEMTSRWLTRNSIENFCKGEERIHRFCFEVQKCVNKLGGASLLDSPVLWCSRLFEREKLAFDKNVVIGSGVVGSDTTMNTWSRGSIPSPLGYGPAFVPTSFQSLRTNDITSNISRLWNTPRTALHESMEPDLMGFPRVQGPASTKLLWPDKSSAIPSITTQFNNVLDDSFLHRRPYAEDGKVKKKAFIHQIKHSLNSLLLSDLGYLLWAHGSETDAWVNLDVPRLPLTSNIQFHTEPNPTNGSTGDEGRPESNPPTTSVLQEQIESDGLKSAERSSTETPRNPGNPPAREKCVLGISELKSGSSFPYLEAYKSLLQKFSASPDPHVKLQMLYELEMLVLNSIQQRKISEHFSDTASTHPSANPSINTHLTARTTRVPRTKATSLEEVIANCFERRAGTLKSRSPNRIPSPKGASFYPSEIELPDTDDVVNTLLAIFRDSNFRPQTLFRDLQLIAAFVPPEILDRTPKGKAFWDAGLAALALKEDLCESMIDRANQITTYHISGKKDAMHDPSTTQHFANITLKDAAELWIITAKEGSPTAARELGLFYLTHPELLPRVTLPLSKSKDVFRSAMSNDRSGNESGALDPLTFAVVFHWMESAANGGDKDAKDFLRGNGDLSTVI